MITLKDKKKLEMFISAMSEIFKEKLKSIFLYGSYARGDFIKGISDINILVVVEDLRVEDLIFFRKRFSKKSFKMNIKPVFFTTSFVRNSSDVFPLQWYEIKKYGICLYGMDIRDEISVSSENMKLQLEREIKQQYFAFQEALIYEKDVRSALEFAYWRMKVVQKGLSYLYPGKDFSSSHMEIIKEAMQRRRPFKIGKQLLYKLLKDHIEYLERLILLIDKGEMN